MRIKFVSTLLLAGLLGIAARTYADPITYTYTPISVPGSTNTVARGLNNTGQIVGSYADNAGTHGFLYSNGNYTTVNAPDGSSTQLLGINNSGQIVGTYQDSSNIPHLFLDNNGTFTTINPPRGLFATPSAGVLAGINDLGQIASATSVSFGNFSSIVGFLYDQGQFTFIPSLTQPSITSYFATGINNAGKISFTANDVFGNSSLVYSNGELMPIGAGVDASSIAFGINNLGDVAGIYYGGDYQGAYVYSSSGIITRFDISSFPNFSRIYGINDKGQLIGGGLEGAVLATPNTAPVPEPGSLILLGVGLSSLALLARNKFKKAWS